MVDVNLKSIKSGKLGDDVNQQAILRVNFGKSNFAPHTMKQFRIMLRHCKMFLINATLRYNYDSRAKCGTDYTVCTACFRPRRNADDDC